MAFRPFERRESGEHPDFSLLRRSSDGAGYNVFYRMTCGVRHLYQTILSASNRTQTSVADSKDPGLSSVLLSGRYRPLAILGKGTFSQLVLAEDLYSPIKRHVAIKIMNKGCDYIGIQVRSRMPWSFLSRGLGMSKDFLDQCCGS
jgi:hypothetical protein